MPHPRFCWAILALAMLCIASLTARAGEECVDAWTRHFECMSPGITGSMSYYSIYAAVMFDDGSGEALYVAGQFTHADCEETLNIARWDGAKWSAVGGGITPSSHSRRVYALAVFDDGTGPALYAGGRFDAAGGAPAMNLARWDGQSWSAVGAGSASTVYSLLPHHDGENGVLYVGGDGGVQAWDGEVMTALGALPGQVYTMTMHDSGDGPALHVAGALGIGSRSVVRWNGLFWVDVGQDLQSEINSIISYDDGSGAALYAAGQFAASGNEVLNYLARLENGAWIAAGSGSQVQAHGFTIIDFLGETKLYVIGRFTGPDGETIGIATWDGEDWDPVPDARFGARAMTAGFQGDDRVLFAVNVGELDGVPINGVARWDGARWSTMSGSIDNAVQCMTEMDGEVVIGGHFTDAMGVRMNGVARYDGRYFTNFGDGFDGPVRALAAHEDNGVSTLYAAGMFTSSGETPVNNIAAWDGEAWSALAGGLDGMVNTLAVFDDGAGPALYAGGDFQNVGGLTAAHLARWDGASWSVPPGAPDDTVLALEVFDDGGGPALYVGGGFTNAGGQPAARIARWDGQSWQPLGQGVAGTGFPFIHALEVFDDGAGPALSVGGRFTTAGSAPASNVARWDGASWAPLGAGANNVVTTMRAYDPGGRPMLAIAGYFGEAGGQTANQIALWDGLGWSSLGAGVNGLVVALAALDHDGPRLYVGGEFLQIDGVATRWFTYYTACALADCPGDTNGDRIVDFTDLNAVIATFGQSGEPGALPGDLDGDGSVGFSDLNAVLVAFGASCL